MRLLTAFETHEPDRNRWDARGQLPVSRGS